MAVAEARPFNVTPAGRDPALIDQLNGGVPLEAVQVSVYQTPTVDGPLAPAVQVKDVIDAGGSVMAPE